MNSMTSEFNFESYLVIASRLAAKRSSLSRDLCIISTRVEMTWSRGMPVLYMTGTMLMMQSVACRLSLGTTQGDHLWPGTGDGKTLTISFLRDRMSLILVEGSARHTDCFGGGGQPT